MTYRQWIGLVLIAVLGWSCLIGGTLATPVSAGMFTDTAQHWAYETIEWAAARGIVDGYEDGRFRPDQSVSEPEFVAMLVRTFPELGTPQPAGNRNWYEPYYDLADKAGLEVVRLTGGGAYTRGDVARLIASVAGWYLNVPEAVQYLLDQGLAEGRTEATVAGFAPQETLTRAEAVQFLRNLKDRGLAVSTGDILVSGLRLGMDIKEVEKQLGQPVRIDTSRYGFDWYIYHRDYTRYTMVGVAHNRVVGLYALNGSWRLPGGLRSGDAKWDITGMLGDPLAFIDKSDAKYMIGETQRQTAPTYRLGESYVTFYYDVHDGNRVAGILVTDRQVEESSPMFGLPDDRLRDSYERQLFDLANAARVYYGLAPFGWSQEVAVVSVAHSLDMIERRFFDHVNPDGLAPHDRAVNRGLAYRLYGENIAAGTADAIAAHHAWMNSEGHRNNILGKAEFLGVGVAFGGEYTVYYTQNFYTPLSR